MQIHLVMIQYNLRLGLVYILVFENNKILVECLDDILEVKGEDLVINKLLNDELLIEGKIISISFRGYNV